MSAQNERYVEHSVEHYRQRYNWDCGVSCVLMLLPPQQQEEFLDSFEQICHEEGFRQSTWTIDLCYLLKRFDIRHCMYTTILGVNEGYKRHGYYDKIINMDRERVKRRFDEATACGIDVQKHSLTHAELLRHLCTAGPAVVLVDAALLVCDLCKHNKLKAEFRRCFGGAYSGHYIVVVGHSRGKLLYRDPALTSRVCAASPATLHRARRANGTDEDVILVYRDYRCMLVANALHYNHVQHCTIMSAHDADHTQKLIGESAITPGKIGQRQILLQHEPWSQLP